MTTHNSNLITIIIGYSDHATLTNTCAYCPKYQSDMQHLRVCMCVCWYTTAATFLCVSLLVTEQTLQVCQLAYTLSRPVHTHTRHTVPATGDHASYSTHTRPKQCSPQAPSAEWPLCLPHQFSFDVPPKIFDVVPNSAQTTPTHYVLVLYLESTLPNSYTIAIWTNNSSTHIALN